MTDRRDDERDDDHPDPDGARPGPTATEGVRILGAKEAQEALDGGQVSRRIAGDSPRFGDVPARPDPAVRAAARFPRPVDADDAIRSDLDDLEAALTVVDDDDEEDEIRFRGEVSAIVADTDARERAASDTPVDDGVDLDEPVVIDVSDDTSGPLPLPHWTEPPTGEVPIILPESDVIDDPDADDDLDAWAAASAPRFRSGAGDWAEADFADPQGLKDDDTALGALAAATDDDAEFDRSVAQRRRRRLRVRGDADADAGPVAGTGAAGAGAGSGDDRVVRLGTSGSGAAASAGTGASARRAAADARESSGEVRPVGRVDAEPPGPPGARRGLFGPGSDLLTRVVVGAVLGVAALICLGFGRGSTAVLATIIVGVGAFEFYEALRTRGFKPATILGLLAAVTTPLAAYKVGEAAFPLMLVLLTVFSLLWYLFDVVDARPLVSVAVTVFGYVYIGVLGGYAGLLLVTGNGVGLVLGVVICAVAYDVFGYLVGSWLGKTPLMPHVSPNKTLEGLLGGMTASVVVAALIVNRITPWTDLGHALSLGVVVAIMAPLGDLAESLLKRDLKVKDFGAILPGHGGVLDRFDAILFCLPAAYYLAQYFKIG